MTALLLLGMIAFIVFGLLMAAGGGDDGSSLGEQASRVDHFTNVKSH